MVCADREHNVRVSIRIFSIDVKLNCSIPRMIIFKDSFIVPTRILWLALLVMIGIFGFLAQALLTMGLQRETAGRGAMAMYIQVRLSFDSSFSDVRTNRLI